MYDSLIFDLDGTLWDSTDGVLTAFLEVLGFHSEIKDIVTKEKLQSFFGLPLDDIAKKLFLSVEPEHAIAVMKECCENECKYLAKNNGKIYEGLVDIFTRLHKNYPLFIVSNCQEGYIQCFLEANKELVPLIDDFEYPGRSGKLKADNIRMIIERNHLTAPLYIGDTIMDAESCREAGVPFCFAAYGFGNVTEYAHRIDSLAQIEDLLK